MVINDIDFRETCGGCPEQYDAFDPYGRQIGYVRLRWGHLYAEYPYVGGEVVYEFQYEDGWLGMFPSDEDRQLHLNMIAIALKRRMAQDREKHE